MKTIHYTPSQQFREYQDCREELPRLLNFLGKKDVFLSQGGVSDAPGGKLDVEKISAAFHAIAFAVDKPSKEMNHFNTSYGIKHWVEVKLATDPKYVSNGDCIAAMFLKGYKAQFPEPEVADEDGVSFVSPNCYFNAFIKGTAEQEKAERKQERALEKAARKADGQFHPYRR